MTQRSHCPGLPLQLDLLSDWQQRKLVCEKSKNVTNKLLVGRGVCANNGHWPAHCATVATRLITASCHRPHRRIVPPDLLSFIIDASASVQLQPD